MSIAIFFHLNTRLLEIVLIYVANICLFVTPIVLKMMFMCGKLRIFYTYRHPHTSEIAHAYLRPVLLF